MRLVPLIVFALLLAGCGAAQEETNVPAASVEEGVETTPPPTASAGPDPKPPEILLVSSDGEQRAAQGSYCVSGSGVGACADMAYPLVPESVTAVRRGDSVTILLPASKLKRDSVVRVRPLGCVTREVATLELPTSGELRWEVDLDAGAYQLDVFARFEGEDGINGDTSASLGLTVAGAKSNDALGVLGIKPSLAVCKFPV
jgi:hypothetical protein